MPCRNPTARIAVLFASCVFIAGFATHAAAQDGDGRDHRDDGCHGQREPITGIVDQLQLIDSTSMGGGRKLIIHLETGEAFQFPHADHVAAGSGVKVRIRYCETSGDDELPVACSAEVLALPLDGESGESLQQTSQPFEVYRNPDC